MQTILHGESQLKFILNVLNAANIAIPTKCSMLAATYYLSSLTVLPCLSSVNFRYVRTTITNYH